MCLYNYFIKKINYNFFSLLLVLFTIYYMFDPCFSFTKYKKKTNKQILSYFLKLYMENIFLKKKFKKFFTKILFKNKLSFFTYKTLTIFQIYLFNFHVDQCITLHKKHNDFILVIRSMIDNIIESTLSNNICNIISSHL